VSKHTRVVMELDSTEAIKSAVEAGLGVGFVSRRAIQKELKLDTLREVHVTKLGMQRTFAITYPRGPEPRGAAGAFLRFLREKRDREVMQPSSCLERLNSLRTPALNVLTRRRRGWFGQFPVPFRVFPNSFLLVLRRVPRDSSGKLDHGC